MLYKIMEEIKKGRVVKRGYRAEKRRMDELRKEGWVVFRVSGSIGYIDILAFREKGKKFEILLEQVKSTKSHVFYFDKRSLDEFTRLLYIQGKLPSLTCNFVIYGKVKNKIVKKVLNLKKYNLPPLKYDFKTNQIYFR